MYDYRSIDITLGSSPGHVEVELGDTRLCYRIILEVISLPLYIVLHVGNDKCTQIIINVLASHG